MRKLEIKELLVGLAGTDEDIKNNHLYNFDEIMETIKARTTILKEICPDLPYLASSLNERFQEIGL